MQNLTRNSGVEILNITSTDTTTLNATNDWDDTNIPFLRGLNDGTTLTSTEGSTSAEFPYPIDDKIAFLVTVGVTEGSDGVESQQLQVTAGDGWRSDLGDYTLNFHTSGETTEGEFKKWIVGPFESGQFASVTTSTSTATGAEQGDQIIKFELTTERGSLQTEEAGKVNILPFKFPVVTYSS